MKKAIFIALCLLVTAVHAQAGPLTRVLGITVMEPPQNASGTDALNVKWEQATYSCLNFPAVTESVPGGTCKSKVMALKSIQCKADWLKSQELLDYLGCLSDGSTGDYAAYYSKLAKLLKR